MSEHYVETDVLVIGCGIAGGIAALRLADAGLQVTVITAAQEAQESNTLYAQGGIIYRGSQDSAELLAQDLIQAGDGLNNREAVRLLAEEGPPLLRAMLIERLGVPFERQDGELLFTREAAHSTARILHVGDATGHAIESHIIRALREQPHITLLTSHTAVDLLTPAHHSLNRLAVYDPPSCVGAYVYDQVRDRVIAYIARKTILATGGLGQIFLHTTNPPGARGDGIAMAYHAGARIINAEYVQFHPTAFYYRDAARFLVTEAVRGEGGRLVNENGEPFMHKYAPKWKDLAPRDVVARSIHLEMLAAGSKCVYLDLASHMSADQIRERFPTIYEKCREYGVDITRDLIPVVPAAHYFCGGVWADIWGRTNIHNLYAVGEVSCTGVHGANRLGSASLLEGLVWGWRAGEDAARTIAEVPRFNPNDIPPWYDAGLAPADPALIQQDMTSIKHIMWNYVGLVRSKRRLQRAYRDLRNLQYDIEEFYGTSKLSDALIGLRNMVRAAIIVQRAAWENRQSRGCHYRED